MSLLAGCQSGRNVAVDENYHFCIPSVATASPVQLNNEANVRFPEVVKAYGVNRYVDPNDSRIMHERHVVYRVEQEKNWNLQTEADKQILVGPVLSDASLDNRQALLEKELAIELKRQRQLNTSCMEAIDQLNAEREMLATYLLGVNAALEKQNQPQSTTEDMPL